MACIRASDGSELPARARSIGAEVLSETTLPGVGRVAELRDPDGSSFSVIEFERH